MRPNGIKSIVPLIGTTYVWFRLRSSSTVTLMLTPGTTTRGFVFVPVVAFVSVVLYAAPLVAAANFSGDKTCTFWLDWHPVSKSQRAANVEIHLMNTQSYPWPPASSSWLTNRFCLAIVITS